MGGGSGKHQHLQGPSQWSVSTGQRRVVPRPHVQLTVVLQQQRPGSSVQGPGSFRLDHLCDRQWWVVAGFSPRGCLDMAAADAMQGACFTPVSIVGRSGQGAGQADALVFLCAKRPAKERLIKLNYSGWSLPSGSRGAQRTEGWCHHWWGATSPSQLAPVSQTVTCVGFEPTRCRKERGSAQQTHGARSARALSSSTSVALRTHLSSVWQAPDARTRASGAQGSPLEAASGVDSTYTPPPTANCEDKQGEREAKQVAKHAGPATLAFARRTARRHACMLHLHCGATRSEETWP